MPSNPHEIADLRLGSAQRAAEEARPVGTGGEPRSCWQRRPDRRAARVLDKTYRVYRGSLAVTTEYDSVNRRKSLFKDYEELEGIDADQRIGATLITSDDLRAWFDELAGKAIAYIDGPEIGES